MEHTYNWKKQREKSSFIALENGMIFRGYAVGAEVDSLGEVVFNTGLCGYQEIITDPSYSGQFVTMTYTEIGNYGFANMDNESRKMFLNGFIINNMNEPSSWRSDSSLSDALRHGGVPAIAGIDTRELTLILRESGTMKAYMHCSNEAITPEEGVKRAQNWEGLDNQDYASKVSCKEAFEWDTGDRISNSWGIPGKEGLPKCDLHVVAYDFGIKWNILRQLRNHGMRVTVVPAKTPASDVLRMNPDGIFFSNGPADPAAVTYAIENAKKLIGKKPVMGICLGHQILGIACGGKRFRLKFGHHGCNHPVKNLLTGAVEITSQNHNFAIDFEDVPSELEVTHINLNDNTVEGIRHKTAPMFAVQYNPEAAPGPHDPVYLFQEFRKLMGK